MTTNFDKWMNFLKPENLKSNLISSSLYIATFESFKEYVIEEVKFFYNTGFSGDEYTFSPRYNTNVLSKNKCPLFATLLWLQEHDALGDADIILFDKLKKYRNKLSHEMMSLLFEGSFEDFPENLSLLMGLRIKIEKWWVLNIEIPTTPDFDSSQEIGEDDIHTSSQIFYRVIMDMLSGNEDTANFYYKEFLKHKDKK